MDAVVTYHAGAGKPRIDVSAILESVTDTVLADGDVEKALQRAFRFGTEDDIGLLDVLDRLREESREIDLSLQETDQHASEMEMVQSERKLDDTVAMRESLRQVESLDDLQGLDPELMQRTLTPDEMEWVEKWADMTGQLIESGLVMVQGNRLRLTSKAIRRIGSQLLRHMFLPPHSRGRGAHLIHRPGTHGVASEDVVSWEWGKPLDLHITRSLANAMRRPQPGGRIKLTIDDFEVYDRESGAAVSTVLLIDMSRSMFESGAWDAAKRAAIALNTLMSTSHVHDRLELVGFSGDARKIFLDELPSLSWDQFSHGTNLHAGLLAASRILERDHGMNRQVVIITDGEPTAFMDADTPIFEHPVTDRTIHATLLEARRLVRRGVSVTTIHVGDHGDDPAFATQLLRATAGRLIEVPLESLGAFVVRDIASGTQQFVR